LQSDGLRVLPVTAPAAAWARVCAELAGQSFTPLASRTWSDVAAEHEELYQSVLARRRN
jgi:hypothetical protein